MPAKLLKFVSLMLVFTTKNQIETNNINYSIVLISFFLIYTLKKRVKEKNKILTLRSELLNVIYQSIYLI